MTDETWSYNPDAGRWDIGRPPTRAEAIGKAVECASASVDNTISPDAGIARAHSAQAWAAVAAVLPVEVPRARAATVMIGACGHARTAMRIVPDGNWIHVQHLTRCDTPPESAQEVTS
jgi:hypothetical protein